MKRRASTANKLFLFFLWLVIPLMTSSANLHSIDSLLLHISQQPNGFVSKPGAFNIEAYVSCLSRGERQGLVGKNIPHLLPFQANPKKDVAFEAIVQASYHWPGGVKFSCKTINSTNNRRSRAILKDYYHTILPGIEVRDFSDRTSGKFHVLPFTPEGIELYDFQLSEFSDSLRYQLTDLGFPLSTNSCIIDFSPKRKHHTMLSGQLVVDSIRQEVIGTLFQGRIDMATIESCIIFHQDSIFNQILPYISRTRIHYNYGGAKATNSFNTIYKYKEIKSLDSIKSEKKPSRDLTSTYQTTDMNEANFDTIRPLLLSTQVDSVLYTPDASENHNSRKKYAIYTISEHMVEGGRFGDKTNNFRLYGPLDPATFGYDGINGFSINQRIRWNKIFKNGSSLYLNAEIGYAFKIKELRYKSNIDWTFLPKSRQGLALSFQRNNTGLSSKYVESINQALQQKKDTIDFYGLGIDYFQQYEFRMAYHTELKTGLYLSAGLQYNYREPVKHGIMAASAEHRKELANQLFNDFAPFIRLEWTPKQYYYFEGKRKIYINGNTPTFILEATKAIPNVWKANSDYGRVELDVTQNIPIAQKRVLSYRLGTGTFYNQNGEYFISYHYFTRRDYPTNWPDNHFGGIFQLLEGYWFDSSPSYMRGHLMYETPYGLFHRTIRPLTKYIIKERAYANLLQAEGKNFYTELGYAVSNNYINFGVFIGFKGADFYKVGVKFKVELERLL